MFQRASGGQRSLEFHRPVVRGGDLGSPPWRKCILSLPLLLSVHMEASVASATDAPHEVYVTSELSDTVTVVAGEPPG